MAIMLAETPLLSIKVRTLASLVLVSMLLGSCVTTTTGGFNVEASDEDALDNYIQLAVAYYDTDDMPKARRNLAHALEIDDRNSEAYNVLALIFQREGDQEFALENFRRSIRLDRTNSRTRNNYAALLFAMGDYEAAFDELETVTKDTMYDCRAVAFENLGRSALRLGRLSDAEAAFQRALQLNSNLYVSSVELALLLARERNGGVQGPPLALSDYHRFLRYFPEDAALQQRLSYAN